MRQILSGTGVDTTATVKSYMAAKSQLKFANLYMIGDYEDPQAVRLTNWPSPLLWSLYGTFLPGKIKRGPVTSKIGLSVDSMDLTWTPANIAPANTIATANPYQLATMGFYDNRIVRCWMTVMPTDGDANTYGAGILFGGRIGKVVVKRGEIVLTVNSFLDVVNEMVPTNVIETTNGSAGYAGVTPPAGLAVPPQFAVISPATDTVVIGDETTPNAHQVFPNNALAGAFLIFNGGAGTTLGRVLARIATNYGITITGTKYCVFNLYDKLPWAPTPGSDTFFVGAQSSVNPGAVITAALNVAGTGYTVGDIITVTGGGGVGCTISVVTIGGGGAITSAMIITVGAGYANTTGAAVTGGTGTGATFNLTTFSGTRGFPYVPAPQSGL